MAWRDQLLLRLRPPARSAEKPPRDGALEALRGLCAMLVFYAHVFLPLPALDPGYAPSAKFWWFNFGAAAVLVFFVMSGYVIGLTVHQPITRPGAGQYLLRRAARLLPVAYAAILLGWLLQPGLSGHTLLGNFLFLQNDIPYPGTGWQFPLLVNNSNLWTLNYEAFYYLVFIIVWWLAPSAGLLFGFITLLAFGPTLGLPVPVMLARHACGAYYWMGGLCLAWCTAAPPPPEARRSHWLSALLSAYALWVLGALRLMFLDASFDSLLWSTSVSPHRLDFLPASLWCVLAVTGRSPAAQKFLAVVCLGWGWFGLGWVLLAGHWGPLDYLAGAALLAASGLMFRPPLSLAGLRRLAPLGAISFGVYAFASPLQIGLCTFLPEFSGTVLTFTVRLLVVLALTVGLAWLVDHRLHTWLAARLRRPR